MYFSACDYEIDCPHSRADAEIHLNRVHSAEYAGVILDLRLAREDGGLPVLNLARQCHPVTCRILLTAMARGKRNRQPKIAACMCFCQKTPTLGRNWRKSRSIFASSSHGRPGVEAFLRWSVQ